MKKSGNTPIGLQKTNNNSNTMMTKVIKKQVQIPKNIQEGSVNPIPMPIQTKQQVKKVEKAVVKPKIAKIQKTEPKKIQTQVNKIQNVGGDKAKPSKGPVKNNVKLNNNVKMGDQKKTITQKIVPNNNKPVKNLPVNVNLIKQVDKEKKVVAVIVSLMGGASYDHLFTSVQQKAEEGTQVLVYSCSHTSVQQIIKGFRNQSQNQKIKKMIEHINSVDSDCVVFNWECCSVYSSRRFNQGRKNVFELLQILIERGSMAMFSDFSLKALIKQWDQQVLGPNPLTDLKEYGGQFTLNFDCQRLTNCPSAQLQIIGDMAKQGFCNVQAIAGTIVYGVQMQKADTDRYKLQVLTIVTSFKQFNPIFKCEINGKQGLAGHVLLTYKSGGCILTSMGHWIELMKIDTSQKVLFEVAARQYGQQRAKKMKFEYDGLSEVKKKEYISKNAIQFVQSQAPCKNMSKKAKQKF